MDSLPPELVEGYLPYYNLAVLNHHYHNTFNHLIKKPWTFDGVLVDTLSCVNTLTGFRFRLTKLIGCINLWSISMSDIHNRRLKRVLKGSLLDTSMLCNEYSFRLLGSILPLCLVMEYTKKAGKLLDRLLANYFKDVAFSFKWCVFNNKLERIRDVALTYKEDQPVIVLESITRFLGPSMKEFDIEDLISFNESIKRDQRGVIVEDGLAYDLTPRLFQDPKYVCFKSINIRFRKELLAAIASPIYNKYERGTHIIDEKVIKGIRFGLIYGNSIHQDGVKLMIIKGTD